MYKYNSINDREEVMSSRAETKVSCLYRPLEDILVLNLYRVGGGREQGWKIQTTLSYDAITKYIHTSVASYYKRSASGEFLKLNQ